MAGRGDPRGDHAEAVPVRGDRRHRRGDDDQHPRGAEQRAQLGLPLLLAARRLLRRARAEQPVRSGHDGGLPALAATTWCAAPRTATCSRCTASGSSSQLHREHRARTWPAIAAWGRCASATRRYEHFQHDVYGNIVLGAAQAFHDHRLFRRADAADFAALEAIGEQAWRVHDQPDAGMWELRTRARVHTSSALMCWAACDRLAKIGAHVLALPERVALLARARRHHPQRRSSSRPGTTKRQAFVESFGGNDLDASVLLMAEVGFIEPRDPRFVEHGRGAGGHAVRRPVHAPLRGARRLRQARDGVQRLLVLAHRCAGAHRPQARRRASIFEALLRTATTSGCCRRTCTRRTGELWGNFPQTYSMVGIINGAVRAVQAVGPGGVARARGRTQKVAKRALNSVAACWPRELPMI